MRLTQFTLLSEIEAKDYSDSFNSAILKVEYTQYIYSEGMWRKLKSSVNLIKHDVISPQANYLTDKNTVL